MNTKPMSPTLHELQRSLQSAILNGDDAVLATLLDNSRTSRGTLFGVYRHAYEARLVEVLMNDFPFTRGYIGDDDFSALARSYISAHPSRTQNVRWFGAGFPEFLARARSQGLSELAAIEKAVADAFDSTDAAVLQLSDLVQIPPEDWGGLTFKPHPSAIMLRNSTDAFSIWRSLKNGEPNEQVTNLPEFEHVIVWRQDVSPMVRNMPDEEMMMWTAASRGVRFDELCTMLATFSGAHDAASRAAGYLHAWITSELLCSAEIRGRRKASMDSL